jgi:hypothetical protein
MAREMVERRVLDWEEGEEGCELTADWEVLAIEGATV